MLRHYGKAIALLSPHCAAKTKSSIRVTLIACILFVCLYLVRSYHNSGQEHLRNGVRLLDHLKPDEKSFTGQGKDSKTPFSGGTVEHSLAEALGKFHLQAALLGQPSTFDVEVLLQPLPT
jgi:hypothetical protein